MKAVYNHSFITLICLSVYYMYSSDQECLLKQSFVFAMIIFVRHTVIFVALFPEMLAGMSTIFIMSLVRLIS